MTSITLPDLLTIIFVLVDDWYRAQGQKMLIGKPGVKPAFSDSEVMTLMIAQDYIPSMFCLPLRLNSHQTYIIYKYLLSAGEIK